jgi:hypothetical protein
MQKQRMLQIAVKRMEETTHNSHTPYIPIDGLDQYEHLKKKARDGSNRSSESDSNRSSD